MLTTVAHFPDCRASVSRHLPALGRAGKVVGGLHSGMDPLMEVGLTDGLDHSAEIELN